ncbi:MAG: hypothetical protein ACREEW_04425 [Caulobacteraceae bacterium]
MRPRLALACLAAAALAGPSARAGVTRCWIDNGAVVAPAALGDIAGDFLFDLSAPRSELHLTRAQGGGLEGPAMTATLRLAGERIPATFAVADLDARSWGFPSTINGLIGADVLAGYVVEVRLAPCRIALWRRRPPRAPVLASLPVHIVSGVPTVEASIFDGQVGETGWFAIDTGTAAVRVSTALAALSRAPKGLDPDSRVRPPARLAAVGLAGSALTNLPASLENDLPSGLVGGLGDAVWSRYAGFRLDLRRGRLQLLAPKPRPSVSGRRRARSGGS